MVFLSAADNAGQQNDDDNSHQDNCSIQQQQQQWNCDHDNGTVLRHLSLNPTWPGPAVSYTYSSTVVQLYTLPKPIDRLGMYVFFTDQAPKPILFRKSHFLSTARFQSETLVNSQNNSVNEWEEEVD